MWIDTHSHLNDRAFADDYQLVMQRARQAGVERIMVVGYDLESSRTAVRLAGEHEQLYAAVGIHPQDALKWTDQAALELRQMLTAVKVVALGEIGLDYHYDHPPKADQIRVFKKQLALAKQCQKPVIIHNREAHQDILTILSTEQLGLAGGVMHCLTGSREMAEHWMALGLYLSFAGPLTFTNARQVRELAQGLPLDRLLVETDCPYLAPHPQRGRRNEPAWVRLVGEKLAEVKGESVATVQRVTTANAQALFGIN
jgi:TatD DNase family protein